MRTLIRLELITFFESQVGNKEKTPHPPLQFKTNLP